MRLVAAVIGVVGLVACVSPETAPVAAADGDADLFVAEVQPIVAGRCAFLGCHGREGMPLTLFAVDYLRLRDPRGAVDRTRPTLDERALGPVELRLNRLALAARVDASDPAGDRVTRRLVPTGRGGIPHAGVAVYGRDDDPDLGTLRRFFATVHAR